MVRRVAAPVQPLGPEADLVRSYWAEQEELKLPRVPPLGGTVLSSVCVGLGDTLMLTDIPRASRGLVPVFSSGRHFRPLMALNPWWKDPPFSQQLMLVNAPTLVRHYDSGPGHYLQRLRRAFGLPVEAIPRGCVKWTGKRGRNRVVLHFEPGPHALWQRKHVKEGARQLTAQSRAVLEKWIAQRGDLEFWMVGKPPPGGFLRGVHKVHTPTLAELVDKVGQCGWFVGIVSGVMHLATAMQLRCAVIVDFPEAHRIMLPTLRNNAQLESEWLYPQNVHLHQTEEGPLVKRLSVDSLQRALAQELYPYDRASEYAELINERL
jgi:hypothetical protein